MGLFDKLFDFNGDGKSDMLWKNSFIGSNGKESNDSQAAEAAEILHPRIQQMQEGRRYQY